MSPSLPKLPSDYDYTTRLENKALALAKDRKRLRQRLLEARYCLRSAFRKAFTPFTYDFGNQRLLSSDGKLCLQWRPRRYPDQPVSYDNQQTGRGFVSLERTRSDADLANDATAAFGVGSTTGAAGGG